MRKLVVRFFGRTVCLDEFLPGFGKVSFPDLSRSLHESVVFEPIWCLSYHIVVARLACSLATATGRARKDARRK